MIKVNYREKMKEYLKEPDEYSSQYGKWGILNREQRHLIKRLLKEMDSADEVIKQQYFEIERLNNIIKEVREYITSQKLHKIQDTTDGLTYQEIKLLEILDKEKV